MLRPTAQTFVLCALLVAGAMLFAGLLDAAGAAEPVRLIFDTDMGNDVDDAMALGVIHALESRGACRLLAVTLTKDNPLAAAYVDAVNTFYGRGDIPIGVVHNGPTPEVGRFLKMVTQTDDGQLRYPHDLDGSKAPEATALLRRVLADQPDGSVVIAQVGFSTNLARLLQSPPDDISPLSGRELVAKKVRLLSVMAGAFAPIRGNKRYGEYNVVKDLPAARLLTESWPTPIVFSGYEIGQAIRYPAESIVNDFGYVKHHPLAEAYCLYSPPPHNRPTYDLTSVLYGVYPDRGYFSLSEPGRVTFGDDSSTQFVADPNGRHRYLIVNDPQVIRVQATFVQLVSEPPNR